MRIAFFSAKPYEKPFFDAANADGRHSINYIEAALDPVTARLAADHDAVCAFVNDNLSAATLEALAPLGIRAAALRSAGFNHVNLEAADRLGIKVVRVPAYSPHAVAEHAVALILDLNRKIHRAYNRTREGNFSLDGLMGFDLNGLTAGLVGTGKIGLCVARILQGFGMEVIAADPAPSEEGRALGVRFLPLDEVLRRSDVLSLHCPLTPETRHLIDAEAVALMKTGAMLINTSRGAVVDTRALIAGLKTGKIGSVGLDVYEEEENLFFRDLSDAVIQDDVFSRLLTFPNVVVTGHQAFFTRDAMEAIARVTVGNLDELERTGACANQVSVAAYAAAR